MSDCVCVCVCVCAVGFSHTAPNFPAYHEPSTPRPLSPDFQRSNSVTLFNVENGEGGGKEVEYFFASDAR